MTGPNLDEFSQSLGDGGGLDPQVEAMKPAKRRAMFFAVGGVVVLLIVLLVSVFKNKPETPNTVGSVLANGDTIVDSPASAGGAGADTGDLVVSPPSSVDDNLSGGQALIDTAAILGANSETPLVTLPPASSGIPTAPGGADSVGRAGSAGGELLSPNPAANGEVPAGAGAVDARDQGGSGPAVSGIFGGEQQASQAEIRAAAKKEARLRADSLLAAQRARTDSLRLASFLAREARLKGTTSLVSLGAESPLDAVVTTGARAAGTSRFGDLGSGNVPAPATAGAPEAPAAGGLGGSLLDGIEIPPGTRAMAMTTTDFVGFAGGQGQGGGTGRQIVELRLTTALRVKGQTLLPAGTKAYGEVTADQAGGGGVGGGGGAGGGAPVGVRMPVRVQVTTFVTPQGRVIRSIGAVAANPATEEMSLDPVISRRIPQRVGRGLLQTGLDFVVTANTQRLQGNLVGGALVVEQPSPRDIAVLQAMGRTSDLVRGILGDEATDQMTFRLPKNTPVLLMFGF